MLVSEFLTNLKRRGQYQSAQTVLTDADFVAMANDELRMVICPKILSLRDNFFRGQKDYAITGRHYRLPSRILGGRISQILIINGDSQYSLNQMPSTDNSSSFRSGYYVTEGEIVLTGQLPTGTMRVFYPIRPPKMSSIASAAATVSIVNESSISFSVPPASNTYQVIRSQSPFRTISPSVLVSGTGTDQDCTSDYGRFAVGDIAISVDSTHIVPLQEQLCDWLLQRTHMRVLQALGQTDQLQAAGSKLADIERDAMALMSPRAQNASKTVFSGQLNGWNWRQ